MATTRLLAPTHLGHTRIRLSACWHATELGGGSRRRRSGGWGLAEERRVRALFSLTRRHEPGQVSSNSYLPFISITPAEKAADDHGLIDGRGVSSPSRLCVDAAASQKGEEESESESRSGVAAPCSTLRPSTHSRPSQPDRRLRASLRSPRKGQGWQSPQSPNQTSFFTD